MNLLDILNSDIYETPFLKYKLLPINDITFNINKFKNKQNQNYEKKIEMFNKNIINLDRSNWSDNKDKIFKPLYIKLKNTISKEYKGENVTVAWIKLYEILNQFKLLNDEDYIFFMCESPGGFIFALNHFCKTNNLKYNWVAQSLNPSQKKYRELFIDEFGLMKHNSKNYDFGITNTGDVTSLNNILYYHNKYNNKINLSISDCGLDCSKNFRMQETTLCKLFWSQLIITLGILKKKGNYIMKMFTFENYNTLNFLSIINYHFSETFITKPKSSKKFSNEIYIVAKNFKGINKSYLEDLINFFKKFDTIKTVFKIPNENLNDFVKISNIYSNQVIKFIEHNKLLNDNWDNIGNNFIRKLNHKYELIDLKFIKEINLKKIQNNQYIINK